MFGDAPEPVDTTRLAEMLRRSSRHVRGAILNLAADLRRETWFSDKHRMERTIPVFEALVQADPMWHVPRGNLGYALKDKYKPDLARAYDCLTRAVELRGERVEEGIFYQYSRALCLIHLDPAFAAGRASDDAARARILEPLRAARRELDATWDQVMEYPDSAAIRAWLELNGAPRLR